MYVSFYKGIGALAGCCVAGPDEVVAAGQGVAQADGRHAARNVAERGSALSCLATRLPRFPAYLITRGAIATALSALPSVRVIPDPPQVPMLHVLLRTGAQA